MEAPCPLRFAHQQMLPSPSKKPAAQATSWITGLMIAHGSDIDEQALILASVLPGREPLC